MFWALDPTRTSCSGTNDRTGVECWQPSCWFHQHRVILLTGPGVLMHLFQLRHEDAPAVQRCSSNSHALKKLECLVFILLFWFFQNGSACVWKRFLPWYFCLIRHEKCVRVRTHGITEHAVVGRRQSGFHRFSDWCSFVLNWLSSVVQSLLLFCVKGYSQTVYITLVICSEIVCFIVLSVLELSLYIEKKNIILYFHVVSMHKKVGEIRISMPKSRT